MKRTFLLSLLAPAAVVAVLLPLGSSAQTAEKAAPTYKYEAYAGYAYTSLNQVNQSRYGLQGVDLSISRDFGRYFGLTAEGDYYSKSFGSPEVVGSTAQPTVSSVLLGPLVHANIYGKFDGFVHGLLGGEHTGGEQQTPHISFAGGFGGGLDYALTPRFSMRAAGDIIGASFSFTGNSAQLGNSPHKSWDSRATIGVVYHF